MDILDPHSPEAEAEAARFYPQLESHTDALRRIFDADPDRDEDWSYGDTGEEEVQQPGDDRGC